MMSRTPLLLLFVLLTAFSCARVEHNVTFQSDFNAHDRTWIGRDFWSVPLEDWRIADGRLECIGDRNNMRVNLLTHVIKPGKGYFDLDVRMGLLSDSATAGNAGFRIGLTDPEDPDIRAACYFGKGLEAGISNDGKLYIGDKSIVLPTDFDLSDFRMHLGVKPFNERLLLTLLVRDEHEQLASLDGESGPMSGAIALFNTLDEKAPNADGRFWFDDLVVSGDKIARKPENSTGPILWTMYTLSRGTVKLTAQMAPLGMQDNRKVQLQLKRGDWQTVAETTIDPAAGIARFRLENWDANQELSYRLLYSETGPDGHSRECEYDGTIRRDPVDRPLVMGGLTCQYGTGFPYTPLVKHLTAQNPDLLYFSGDQIYEWNGDYDIIRFPADRAILNYLGKWYMFGWAFGDLMRDRPTICTPDDHDVFQGNLWGDGGTQIDPKVFDRYQGTSGGYIEPAAMVNVVHATQCAHLPDPYDPAPMKQGISVYYTDLVYGRTSFAIVTDRAFKSGPNAVAFWEGRQDHLHEDLPDKSLLDKPGLKMLGDRQMAFLEYWVTDWRGADMKVLLSQTVFANIATHHGGEQMVLRADLDSGGWPKLARDRAIRVMRKGLAFHIVGDQHVPSISQYGLIDFRDAGWCFCTPAIFVGYERRFLPERLGWAIANPPAHGLPNTGDYIDGFGNLDYVYAMGNPVDKPSHASRYQLGQDRSSGFGLIRFDQENRTIEMHAYRFLSDPAHPAPGDEFPGWPYTISQFDNDGRVPIGHLPEIRVTGIENPVIMVMYQNTGVLDYAVRMQGKSWAPPVYNDGVYRVKIGDPDKDVWQTRENLTPGMDQETLEIGF